MTDKRQKRAAEFIEPFRVKPGSKVTLGKDFDPAFKAGVKKKKEGSHCSKGACSCWPSIRRGWPPRTPGGCWWCCRRWTPPARTGRSAT